MLINPRFKNHLLVFTIICIYFNTALAQVDSVDFFKEKIKEFSQSNDYLKNSKTHVDLLNNLSYQLRYTGQDSVEILAKQALEISRLLNYKKGELEALSNFSNFHLYRGNTDKVIQYGQEVIDNIELKKFPKIEMKIYNQLGQAYFIKQDYPLTYTYFLHALELGEKKNDGYYIFNMNMNLGTMFNLLEDYNEALLFYSDALKYSEKLNDENMNAMVSSNLGYLYIQTGELKKAKSLLLKSINYFKNQKNKRWLAFAYTTLGQLNLKSNDFEEAEINYQKALTIHNSGNDIKNKADAYYGLTRANLGLKKIDKAEEYAYESLDLYKSFKLNTGLEKIYRALYEINKDKKQISKALEYLELTEKLANDISKEKNRRNLSMVNAKLNFEKEKDTLNAKNDLKIALQKKYINWSIGALAVLFIIVLVTLNINKREKLLNKKLENQAIILNENQNTLSEINSNQDRLFSIVGHDLRAPIVSLKELLILYLEDPKGKEYFEKFAPQLKDDLEQVQFTMDNLLHWGKTQMKGNIVNVERIAVKEELETILRFFRNGINKKSILINNEIKENHYTYADLDQFKVIFRNLISNAIKFTPNNGKITVSTKIKNSRLIIQISDNGVGMSDIALQNLFNETDHFSTYGTNDEKGTGLGLRLVKEMVVMNNGEIMVNSTPNKGSDFIVELPLNSA